MALNDEKRKNICKEFANIINKYSVENDSDTPDFILAEYLVQCLETFGDIQIKRSKWFGTEPKEIKEN